MSIEDDLREMFRAHNTGAVQYSTIFVAVVFGLFSLLKLVDDTGSPIYAGCYLAVMLVGMYPIIKYSWCVLHSRRVAEVLGYHAFRCKYEDKDTPMYPPAPEFERFKNHPIAYTSVIMILYVSFFTVLLVAPLWLKHHYDAFWVTTIVLVDESSLGIACYWASRLLASSHYSKYA